MFGLFTLIYSAIFFLNGVIILNDKRFLSRIKLPLSHENSKYLGPSRQSIISLINTTRTVFQIPLIVINVVCIVYEIFLG